MNRTLLVDLRSIEMLADLASETYFLREKKRLGVKQANSIEEVPKVCDEANQAKKTLYGDFLGGLSED